MRIPTMLASLALLLVVGSVSAHAHAMLDHADPRVDSTVNAAPHEVSLSFTENLEPAFSTMEVTGPSGQRVDEGKPHIEGKVMRVQLRADQPGTYQVKWRVLSVDTHTTEGAFSFKVHE
jgi:methionine-rich copper-binding protein CopC